MIEEKIAALTTAIEALTAVLKNSANETSAPKKQKVKAETPATPPPAAVEPPATPEPTPEPAAVTRADISKAAQKALDAGLVDKIRAIYVKAGGKKLDEVPFTAYPLVLADLNALIAAKAEEPAPAAAAVPAAVTLDQIRALGAKIRDAGGTDKLRAIVSTLGVKKLAEVPADKFAEAYSMLQKADDESNADPV